MQWAGATRCCRAWASCCNGFSCCRARALGHLGFSSCRGTSTSTSISTQGSVVAIPRLQSTGSIVVAHRLSCPEACRIFQDQGSNPWLLHWQVNSLPLSHQGDLSSGIILKNKSYAWLTSHSLHASLLSPRYKWKSPYSSRGYLGLRVSWVQEELELERKRTKWLSDLEMWSVGRKVGKLWNQMEVKFKWVNFRKSKTEFMCGESSHMEKEHLKYGDLWDYQYSWDWNLDFFPAENGEFPSSCILKIKMTNLRPQEFHNSNLMHVHHSSFRLAYQHTFSNSNPLFGIFFFHPPVWTTSVQQMQSDQVSRALAQKEVPQSTTLSSLLTIRVLKPLGLRWCTLTGRDGGPRCPKVRWWGILFIPLRPTHQARCCHPWFRGVENEAQTQVIYSNCWMLG